MAFNREKTMANAQKHLRAGKVDKAIKEFERVVADDPSDVRSKLKMADLYVKGERYDEALQSYGEVAYAYANQDLYEKAAAVYKQAMRISPEDPVLYTQLGEAYFRLGRLKDAVRVFHKAQKIYKKNGDENAQRDILERMVRIDPDDVGLRIQLAERHEKDGMRDEALSLFREASEQLNEEGRVDEYVQVLERMIYLAPQSMEMRKDVVRIYLSRGDERHALKHLQHCFKLNAQDIETLELLGSTFHRLGSEDKAVLVYAELAALYNRTGLESRAASAYRTILTIDSSHKEAREFLGQPQPQTRVAVQPVPKPEPEPEPDVYMLDPDEFEDDALDGIEFLDEDDDAGVEMNPTDHGANASGDGFMAFAEDAIRDLEDAADLNQLESYPEAALGAEGTAAAEVSDDSLELVDAEIEPITSENQFDGDDQIKQFLTESDVFLKYGLLDRAEEVITKVLQLAPNNLGGREQMRKLLLRTGDKRGAAHQLVEMARIVGPDSMRANGFILQASELVDSDTLDMMLEGAGVEAPSDLGAPVPAEGDFAEDFLIEVSEGLDEVSSTVQAAQPDADGAYTIDIPEFDEDDLIVSEELVEDVDEIADVDMADFPVDATMEESFDIADIGDLEVGDDLELADFAEADLSMDDVDVVVDVDVDVDEVAFDESALAALDASAASPDDVDLDFSAEDADAMFDELFGGVGEDTDANISALSSEGFDAPGGFGERSLTNNFDGLETFPGSAPDTDNVNNSSLELGQTYKDMGLFSEAIEEFRHAMDDPEAAPAAQYHIALCHLELGEKDSAQQALTNLMQDAAIPESWRTKATAKLADL